MVGVWLFYAYLKRIRIPDFKFLFFFFLIYPILFNNYICSYTMLSSGRELARLILSFFSFVSMLHFFLLTFSFF